MPWAASGKSSEAANRAGILPAATSFQRCHSEMANQPLWRRISPVWSGYPVRPQDVQGIKEPMCGTRLPTGTRRKSFVYR